MNPIDALIVLVGVLLLCYSAAKILRLMSGCVVLFLTLLLILAVLGVASVTAGPQLLDLWKGTDRLFFGGQLDAWVQDSNTLAFIGPWWERFTGAISKRVAVNA